MVDELGRRAGCAAEMEMRDGKNGKSKHRFFGPFFLGIEIKKH